MSQEMALLSNVEWEHSPPEMVDDRHRPIRQPDDLGTLYYCPRAVQQHAVFVQCVLDWSAGHLCSHRNWKIWDLQLRSNRAARAPPAECINKTDVSF